MASGGTITNAGLKLALNRIYKSSPDYSIVSVFKIGTGTNTPTTADTDLQTPVTGWYSGGDTKPFESGYPIIDEDTQEVTIRCRVTSTEANGNLITEFGIFNTDSTALMESRDVFTSISKSNTDEIIFIAKNKLQVLED